MARFPAASEATVWETAFELGARLEAAEKIAAVEDVTLGRTVRPHVRRAHWHSYWTGPRDTERDRVVRWISPLLIKAEPVGL